MPSTLTSPTFTFAAISRFLILSSTIFVIFGLFLFTFSNLIFFIPAGWSNFFTASLNISALVQHEFCSKFLAISRASWSSSFSQKYRGYYAHTHSYIYTHTHTHANTYKYTHCTCNTHHSQHRAFWWHISIPRNRYTSRCRYSTHIKTSFCCFGNFSILQVFGGAIHSSLLKTNSIHIKMSILDTHVPKCRDFINFFYELDTHPNARTRDTWKCRYSIHMKMSLLRCTSSILYLMCQRFCGIDVSEWNLELITPGQHSIWNDARTPFNK